MNTSQKKLLGLMMGGGGVVHLTQQARSDCPAGAGHSAHRGSVERRQEPG